MGSFSPKISVVIPAYNIEAYVDRCLQSVIGQTLQEIEIIVVNDGSTDCTPQIIDRYAALDPRIRVLNKKNAGVQYARQEGIKASCGEFTYTLDGDDYIELDALESLYTKAVATGSDIVAMDFWFENEKSGERTLSRQIPQETDTPLSYFKGILYSQGYWATWRYLFKRSLFDETIITPEKIIFGEDAILTTQLLLRCKKISAVNRPLYHYMIHSNSVSGSRFTEAKYESLTRFPCIIEEIIATSTWHEVCKAGIQRAKLQAYVDVYSFGYHRHLYRDLPQIAKKHQELGACAPVLQQRLKKLIRIYNTHPRWVVGLKLCYYQLRDKL